MLTKGKMYAGKQILIYISKNKLNENLIGIKAKVTEIIKREIKVRILYNPIDFT